MEKNIIRESILKKYKHLFSQKDNNNLKVMAVSMGNPHMIVIVEDLDKIPFQNWGKALEKDINFPSYTNVHFVKVISKNELKVLVWERGCGPTLACGTGACACAVATNKIGLTQNDITVNLPGGSLEIKFKSNTSNVHMSGPATFAFAGTFEHPEI